jgi:hypothetical protein
MGDLIQPAHILIVAVIVALIVTIMRTVIRDAGRRGKSPWLVMLLVLLSFPLGLICWVLLRPDPIDQS